MASHSASEIILPIGTQKHDPAWKHCLMVRSAGRTKLKCMYCLKLFLGGGIHRIKEHLARQKGNASCCPKVPTEVQVAMQQSLEGSAARKRKKLNLPEEAKKLNPNQAEGSDMVSSPIHIIQIPDMLDLGAMQMDMKEDNTTKSRGRPKKKKIIKQVSPSSPLATTQPFPLIPEVGKSSAGGSLDKDQVYMAIGCFLYEAGVPLDAVNSVYFQPMIDAIAAGPPSLQMFSYHDFRGWILNRSIEEINNTLEHYKLTWNRTGCSILADEWTTETGKILINFLVYCQEGTMFLKSVDATHIITSADTFYELLKDVVEEVGVNNVVQIITNSTDIAITNSTDTHITNSMNIHKEAAMRLTKNFPTLFWTPCASRCIEEMLEEILKTDWIPEVMEEAKIITGFIYNHSLVTNIMRKYTNGKDLLLPDSNQIAFSFISLKNMSSLKEELRAMISSDEWLQSPYSKKPGGIAMSSVVCRLEFWSYCDTIVQIVEPLIRVLRLVESHKRPAMGYINAAIYQIKQSIKRVLGEKADYMPYCGIIDRGWKKQLPCPLYAVGFFLNPRFFYSMQGELSTEISTGILDCIERLVPDVKVQDKIQKELNMYKTTAGDFGRKMAVRAKDTLLPAEWWSTYGGACPNLMRLAIRVLSQTCSSRGCERAHIPFEQIHNQRMNNLEHQRLCDLTFLRYNLRLQQRQTLRSKPFDPISVDNIDTVGDWVLEKSDLLSVEAEGDHWMLLNQPISNGLLSVYSMDEEDEAFIAGIDDEVIQGAGREVEIDEDSKEDDQGFQSTKELIQVTEPIQNEMSDLYRHTKVDFSTVLPIKEEDLCNFKCW